MKAVIAIGGNALVSPGGTTDIHDQFSLSRQMVKPLADLVQQGWQLTVTHGNGPQVGSIMRRVEIASDLVYPIDLGLAVADTQAGMGYMIAQTLRNELHNRGVERTCSAIVTSVLVDADDPAFASPTKPIGSFMDEQTAARHREQDGWTVVEDAGRGYRRVVPSPTPLRIIQLPVIKRLVDAGELIIAAGGGGIPVIENDKGEFHGVEAVIDKDLTAAMIAAEIGVDVLAIITSVASVYRNFGKPNQEPIRTVDVQCVESMIDDNQFAVGSMLPKIQAAIQFLRNHDDPNARAIITDWSDVPAAVAGRAGTTITP